MKRVIIICVAILSIASMFTFLFVEAKSMDEYVISAYLIVALSGILCSFIHTSIVTVTVFALMDCDIGEIIEKSKF